MKEFIYDGTFEGLLTAIFYVFHCKEQCTIKRKAQYSPDLLSQPVEINTEEDKFNRVYEGITHKLNSEVMENLYYLYLSEMNNCEDVAVKYLRLCFTYGIKVNLAKNNDIIMLVDKYSRRVALEAERFAGFVRFREFAPLSFYASIEPDHNILPLLIGHFCNRFSDQNFIIHDVKREIAIVYNKKEGIITNFSKEHGDKIENFSNDSEFETLWKTFYNSVNIIERKNEKLRKLHMPKRYWSHLTEVKDLNQ